MYRVLFLHPSVDGFGCSHSFYLLSIVNSGAMNIWLQYLFEHLCSILLGIYLGMELLGHMKLLFNFLRSDYTVFHSGWAILYSISNNMMVPISLHAPQHFLLFFLNYYYVILIYYYYYSYAMIMGMT